MYRSLSLIVLPAIVVSIASIAGCAAPAVVPSTVAATPAVAIYGSCPQKPVRPEAATRENRHGTVALSFHVDADNTLLASKVKRSSGHADLDEAARVGIAKCKFKAATQNGVPVRDWAQIKYVWTKENA